MPTRLFKYACLDRIDVLLKEAIRYTQPSDLNDPYEMRLEFTSLTSDDYSHFQRLMKSEDLIEGVRKAYDALLQLFVTLCP